MASATDLISLDEAKAELSISDTDTSADLVLGDYITGFSDLIDTLCGPVVIRPVVGEQHECPGRTILLAVWPVASVTAVTEWSGGTPTTLTADSLAVPADAGYRLDLDAATLRRFGGGNPRLFSGTVSVDYDAGRYADTASVGQRFKQACTIAVAQMWKREHGMGTVTFGPDGQLIAGATYALPNAALTFIQNDLLHGVN